MTKLLIKPLGGLGEIGSNTTVFETENYNIIIDFGMLFPKDRTFEINYLSVNPELFNNGKKNILFITHGHEDHIGAISQLLKTVALEEIHAPLLAKNLIHKKLSFFNMGASITTFTEDTELKFDDVEVHPVHVTHSIPQTFGVILKQKETSVLFISDFKFDLNPSFERPFHFEKIQKIFDTAKTRIAMLDSTNILNKGKTPSESDVIPALDNALSKNKRTFITLFSSNIYRVKNILELSKKHNRKVVFVGRSLYKYMDIAQDSQLLNLADYNIKNEDEIKNSNDPSVLILLTGCQGEFKGATRRIVNGDHKQFKLAPDDQFIFSSKTIPGNEKEVADIYNKVSEQGVDILTDKDALIHASGHPGQEDLKELLSRINPTHYIPIHGESFFLQKHIEFIQENFSHIKPIKLFNQDSFDTNSMKPIQNNSENEPLLLIQNNDREIERGAISKRRKIAQTGACFISIKSRTEIEIDFVGLPDEANLYEEDLTDLMMRLTSKLPPGELAEEARIKARQFFKAKLDYKPITYVHTF